MQYSATLSIEYQALP